MDTRRRWSHTLSPVLGTGAGILLGVLLVVGALAGRAAQADDRFDLLRWEIETVPNRWLHLAGSPFRTFPPDDEVIAAYFSLPPDDPERDALENRVERVIEGRIDRVLREFGLNARLPLPFTFPPVDIELAISPRVVVVSPRHVVERASTDLLRPDLTLEEAIAIEDRIEGERPAHAALVVGSGGVATYPAIVSDRTTYPGVVATAAHEWIHHYLAFYPLGLRYQASGDLRTINETVADLAGQEIARVVLDRWGDPTRPAGTEPPLPPPPAGPGVDRVAILRELRLEVDALLQEGRIEDAEARMQEVRDQLEEAGIYIRRINQAYFAWYGTYAARADAVDPLGGYLREVRARSGSLRQFLVNVRGVGSRSEVVEVLVELGGVTEPDDRSE